MDIEIFLNISSGQVYALYRKDWRIGLFLAILFFAHVAVEAFVAQKAVDVTYDPICDATQTPSELIYLGYLPSLSSSHSN